MLQMLKGLSQLAKEPATFAEYVRQQLAIGLLKGPPYRADVVARAPRWLARMAVCESSRARLRRERGIAVPSVMFMAVTGRCNLKCRHCYTQRYAKEHMALPLARSIIQQAYGLGVSLFIVSGGEPLLHREFFGIVRELKDKIPFVVFTNGSLLPQFLDEGLESPNMLWLVSVDGPRPLNDARRGDGMFDMAIRAMAALREHNLPFGFSATCSVDNVRAAASLDFVEAMADQGCRAGFFLEQIPGPASEPTVAELIEQGLVRCRAEASVPVIGFPADELRFGGCQAGGDGISHVSPEGYLEPCPAARLAADSLAEVSLETALSNPFFKEFRELKARYGEEGGCESCTYSGHEETFEDALARYGAKCTV